MLIKFTNTAWLNAEPQDILRIDIDVHHLENLSDAVYYVEVTFIGGQRESSGFFKTFEEARICAENFARALMEE